MVFTIHNLDFGAAKIGEAAYYSQVPTGVCGGCGVDGSTGGCWGWGCQWGGGMVLRYVEAVWVDCCWGHSSARPSTTRRGRGGDQ